MSNYSKTTNFATKDGLSSGDPLKVVKGAEIDTEFNNIATMSTTKQDSLPLTDATAIVFNSGDSTKKVRISAAGVATGTTRVLTSPDADGTLSLLNSSTALTGAIQNLSLSFSVAANALTCDIKTRAGVTGSATDTIYVAMRNATLSTGDFSVRSIVAALSLVISSGSTLGHANATAGNIFWYVIDNAGTLELAASTTYFGKQGIVTTTAEGGAGAADSATIMYSTTARTNVAYRVIGHTIDTQTTAGTWAAVPTTSELAPFDGFAASITVGTGGVNLGTVVKRKTADESVTSSTTLQDDDHLTFAIAANEEWIATFQIDAGNALNLTGFQVAVTVPSGATLNVTLAGNPAQTGGSYSQRTSTSGASLNSVAGAFASSASGVFIVTVWVLNGATPGNVTLQWAQGTSSGTALTFRKGSFLQATRAA